MNVESNYDGMVACDCLRVGGRIVENLHHLFDISSVLLYYSSEIVFVVASISGSNACAYYKNVPMTYWTFLYSYGFSAGESSVGCAS